MTFAVSFDLPLFVRVLIRLSSSRIRPLILLPSPSQRLSPVHTISITFSLTDYLSRGFSIAIPNNVRPTFSLSLFLFPSLERSPTFPISVCVPPKTPSLSSNPLLFPSRYLAQSSPIQAPSACLCSTHLLSILLVCYLCLAPLRGASTASFLFLRLILLLHPDHQRIPRSRWPLSSSRLLPMSRLSRFHLTHRPFVPFPRPCPSRSPSSLLWCSSSLDSRRTQLPRRNGASPAQLVLPGRPPDWGTGLLPLPPSLPSLQEFLLWWNLRLALVSKSI